MSLAIPSRAARWLGRCLTLVLLLPLLVGCGDGVDRGSVKGRVTVGGQPLVRGRVLFHSEAAGGGPTVSVLVTNGAYEMDRKAGPLVGPNRVEVEGLPELGFEIDDEAAFARQAATGRPAAPNPVRFFPPTELRTEIRDGENVFDIDLPQP